MAIDRPVLRKMDVVALCCVLMVCMAIVPAALGRVKADEAKTACAKNINYLMKCMLVYSNENNDTLPAAWAGPSATQYAVSLNDKTIPKADSPKINKERAGDPTASFWILVSEGSAVPKSFICPSDPFTDVSKPAASSGKDGSFYLGFQDKSQFSYSIAYPWTKSDDKGGEVGGWWRANIDSSLPAMTDMAPFNEPKGNPVIDPEMKNAVNVQLMVGQSATMPSTQPATQQDLKAVFDKLIVNLNDDSFAVRSKAAGDLMNLGQAAVPLVKSLDLEKQTGEVHGALTEFLDKMQILVGKTYNSPNHGFSGQNIGYADSHVEWATTPEIDKHNIWLNADEKPISAGDIGKPTVNVVPYKPTMVPARASDGSIK